MRFLMRPAGLLAMLALALPVHAEIAPVPTQVLAGEFHMDPIHTRLIFRVDHLSFSMYTAFFTGVEANLSFDPENPEAMKLSAKVDAASVETLYNEGGFDFNKIIAGPDFLNAAQFPEITFVSTSIRLTAANAAAVTGDLTLHGVTHPITLRVTFNGGYPGHPMDPGGARIGFSAKGTLFRSDFGVSLGIPAPGTTLGVGDAVEIILETEMLNPDAPGPQAGP